MKHIWILIASLLLAVFVTACGGEDNEAADHQNEDHPATSPVEDEPIVVKGDEEAESEILLVTDYSCPYCVDWYMDILPEIEVNLVDEGVAQFRSAPVSFVDENSERLAAFDLAVKESAPEDYFAIAERLYADAEDDDVTNWGEPSYQEEVLEDFGLDYDDVMGAPVPDTDEFTNAYVEEHGFETVPAVIVDGELMEDSFDYDAIADAVNAE
ncbi:thioredoxin domain-containing protein [Salisediminibacterium halotolerans]|uniref:Protein-disulfide isomerase n=1 Tax=Salisediminibacterium halotolerans TaxID=517425 RepID=A0A1H9W3H1_9BACI|nr:thioredoxin domain-containing protein [Salisediminibacterium haloalkalitolerans]SES28354.1 Protein-disulfide isomerase [Salisediminibacterium haloalkalitolerans]